ncbi:hypothetical protein F5Y08DRAFT_312047 [Xylaria arbuscula]|nr:hypothetical protein F5Y08DRAFT_312047 [Xylaria arbuscula]
MRARLSPEDLPPVPPAVRATLAETLPPDGLDAEHLDILTLAMSNILRTEVAEFTYAQIVDGSPTSLEFQLSHRWPPKDHPVREHKTLCPGAREKTCKLRSEFQITSLRFSPELLRGYQDAQPGTRDFNLRLVEMLVVACHQIAAVLFQLDKDNEHKKTYEAWVSEQYRLKAAGDERWRHREPGPPTAFYHRSYHDHEQYPRGTPDVVGYWAESKIFGGVVLFDRGESETECKEIWLDPSHSRGPTTMYSPTVDQLEDLMKFLRSDPGEPASCPLPIRASKLNRPRFYRYHATKYFHIFRDRYDSRLPERFVDPGGCVLWPGDWPEIEDEYFLFAHPMESLQNGTPIDEAAMAAAKERLKNITPSSPLWRPIHDERYI